MQSRIFTSDSYALNWAKDHLRYDASELVSKAPWARMYKLTGENGGAYLKLFPPAFSKAPNNAVALTKRFPDSLPEVISKDDELGLLLFRQPGGRRLRSNANRDERCKLLQAYANIQARVCQQPDLHTLFPAVDLATLVPSLINFLDSSASRANGIEKVTAAHFIGKTKALRYHDPLSKRAKLIDKYITAANQLPKTINHCDLRLKNATLAADHSVKLANWDDAAIGPAGMSLHAVFDGCARPAALLEAGAAARTIKNSSEQRSVLNAYIETLADGGYAPRNSIEQALTGAICAGAVRDLLWYADYPSDSSSYRRRVARIIEKGLGDLLDFCDVVALRDRDLTLRCAKDYQNNDRPWRAESLLRNFLAKERNDPQAHAQLARVLHAQGKRGKATSAYREAIDLAPDDPQLLSGYGSLLLEDLRFSEAISSFRKALRTEVPNQGVQTILDRACELRDCEREARVDDVMPRLPIAESEQKSGILRPESLALGEKLFNKYGTLLIENAFDENMIRSCNEYYLKEYKEFYSDTKRSDVLPIGDKRLQITVALEGPFNDPGMYANPIVLDLMKRLLGRKFFLGCTVCATSLPGSKDQHLHKDHRALFTKNADDTPIFTPPFAITAMVPLVDLDESIGTTTVRKGSHLVSRRKSANMPQQVPIVPVGSCFLMDLRLSHQGLGNKTKMVRPILNMVYQQPWFADNKNYEKQPPLRISKEEFKKIPSSHKKLFRWATLPGPDVG